MAVSKAYRHVVKCLERHGYVMDHVSSKGYEIFTADGREDVGVNRRITDHAAKTLVRNIDRAAGIGSDRADAKRNPAQIKQRQAGDRERAAAEVERRSREVDELLAERDARMARAGFSGSDSEFKALLVRLEQEERELAYWRQLMTEVPRNVNKVRHRS